MKDHRKRGTNCVLHTAHAVGVFEKGKDGKPEKPIKSFSAKEWLVDVKLDKDGYRYIVSKDGKKKIYVDDLEVEE